MILNRTERQEVGVQRWRNSVGRGTLLYPTGFGKTRVALNIIERFLTNRENEKIIVVVPTDNLRDQWRNEIKSRGINQESVDIYTVHSAIKKSLKCGLLVIDEVHMVAADTFSAVFSTVKYNFLLCLTGTIDRLDGKQKIIKDHAPVCDEITLEEAIKNDWVADYEQVKILIEVDLDEYKKHHKDFLHYFSYFDFNFDLAMTLATDYKYRFNYSRINSLDYKVVTAMAMGFNRSMRLRKEFIYNHPRKIEIANQIIRASENKKIITFTKSVDHAKQICCGEIFHGKIAKKKRDKILSDFNLAKYGVLNTCKAVDVGTDVTGVDTAIIISGDSSSITKHQRVGRAIRKEGDKVAKVYHLVIKGSVEEEWFRKSSSKLKNTIIIEDYQLDSLLKGTPFKPVRDKPKSELIFRF